MRLDKRKPRVRIPKVCRFDNSVRFCHSVWYAKNNEQAHHAVLCDKSDGNGCAKAALGVPIGGRLQERTKKRTANADEEMRMREFKPAGEIAFFRHGIRRF